MKTQIDTKTAVLAVVVLIVLIAGVSSMRGASSKDNAAPALAAPKQAAAAPKQAAAAPKQAATAPKPAAAASKPQQLYVPHTAKQHEVYSACQKLAKKWSGKDIGWIWGIYVVANHIPEKQANRLVSYCAQGAYDGGARS